ncbi:axin-1, partial [Aplysia californica]|uniref:Axin-1 n=1 Tax=Aplysia californica TaxID=6500 RepID=A0ABM1AEP7_APLCA
MTTKVVDFLNESGGSNFTETAPRPPVYGEENELQSNGGNSTRSGSSHKSHVSSKSHSSSKSGTSTKGDHSHSPAMTPRKSNLEGIKSSDTVTGQSQSSLCEYEENEMSAPLGFHPEGSAANSPPYSENGTPPHLKWAQNLKYLLDDSEGVELFKEFMERELEGGSEELQFWFACQGLKRKIDSDSLDNTDSTITNIQKAIYKRYVRSDKVKCISRDVKKDIADKVSSKSSLDHCIFDAAQEEVETFMRDVTYPAFLRSDYYVQYVQNYGDSPKSSQSSGSNSARPVSQSGLLPVVHEDKELETRDISGHMPLPVINKAPSSVKRTDTAVVSARRTETVTGSMLYCPRAPPSYPAHVSYAPVSAQDSEIQSLSSDALTDDTISVTDSSLDGYPLHLRKKHPRKAMKSLAQQNREHRTGLAGQIIPRTEHAPKDRNIAETDPKRFADLLMEKLSKVLEEREADAKVEEKLRSINVVDKSQSEEEKLVTSFAKHNTSASFMPLKLTMEEETAESILDQHCSRIWASSSHHTPSYSPPGRQSPPHGKSPERHKDPRSRAKGMSSSSGSNATPVPAPGGSGSLGGSAGGGGGGQPNLGGRGYHHHHHKKRDFGSAALSSCDSGLPDDRGNLISCGTETHRHIHHHHHH